MHSVSPFLNDRPRTADGSLSSIVSRRCLLNALRIAALLAFWGLGWTDAWADRGAVAHSAQGQRAWAVCRESGPVALTEIWMDGGQGGSARRLGTFPGYPGRLGWAADGHRLLYREEPLELPMFGVSLDGQRTVDLAPAGLWEIPMGGGPVRRLTEGEADTSAVFRTAVGGRAAEVEGSPEGEVGEALAGVGRGFSLTSTAYSALHRWDFRAARRFYRRAAREFEKLPEKYPGVGLFQEPFRTYARALEVQARRAREEEARWVCREHLMAIGDLLRVYERVHEGQRPSDLEMLKEWVQAQLPSDADPEPLELLFRSPADPEKGRAISYYYRPDAAEGEAAVTSFFYEGRLVELVREGRGFRVVDRAVGRAQVDSLLGVGVLEADGNGTEAISVLEMVTQVDPKFAPGHSKLGYAYLKARQLDRALSSFERAVSLDHRLAEVYNGLGLVFRERPKGLYDAIRYFRKALRWDRDYIEARFHIVEARHKMGEHDLRRDAERVIAMDPTFAPVYLLLGEWYEEHEEDYETAALYYARYMSFRPNDPEARHRLANVYLKAQNYDRIVQLLSDYVREHPEEVEVLPILAQVCIKQERLEWAEAYFNGYLKGIDPQERMLYEDIRLLASEEEVAAFNGTAGAEREAFLGRFWTGRDPNLLTTPNERRLEHYRRVWHARQNFSEGRQPWDRRGEVYIRFGEPDYRSRSDMINLDQSLAVQRVKERMVREVYGEEASSMSYFGPVYPVRSLRTKLGGAPDMRVNLRTEWDTEQGAQGEDAARRAEESANRGNESIRAVGGAGEDNAAGDFNLTAEDQAQFDQASRQEILVSDGPLGSMFGGGSTSLYDLLPEFQSVSSQEDASMVPWETWVYTVVNGGIEITFTDENHNGTYDYAPPPLDAYTSIRQLALFNRYSPQRVAEQSALITPDYYVTLDVDPLEFYYDLADFRGGQEGRTLLEVYIGVPRKFARYSSERNETNLVVERAVAVLDEKTGMVYRRQGDLVFRRDGNVAGGRGTFVPDLVRLEVPPGHYRMEVQVKDRLSGRQGRYRQRVVLEDYKPEGLWLSDLALAWQIGETGSEDKFRKGGLHVVPIPTRTYRKGQSVFVYYEIYNLVRDEYGRTNYRIEYTIGPKGGPNRGGIIFHLVRTLVGRPEEVAVGYEQLGFGESEKAYMELDLAASDPGRHYLKVELTDLKSGQTASKEATFAVVK